MYAPTFRQTISFDVFNNNYEKWISAFEKKTGRKCKLLFRLHPNIASLYKNIQIGRKYYKCFRLSRYAGTIVNNRCFDY